MVAELGIGVGEVREGRVGNAMESRANMGGVRSRARKESERDMVKLATREH